MVSQDITMRGKASAAGIPMDFGDTCLRLNVLEQNLQEYGLSPESKNPLSDNASSRARLWIEDNDEIADLRGHIRCCWCLNKCALRWNFLPH